MNEHDLPYSKSVLPQAERDFWARLEFRICRELNGMPEQWQRRYWCDGFIPEYYKLDGEPPHISGRVWMVEVQKQHKWKFVLLLPHPYKTYEEIDWVALLPPENVTRWLTVDPDCQRIEIEPAAAVPDLSP